MKRTVILTGDDTDQVFAALRGIAGEFDVDLVEEPSYADDPMQDIVFWLDRLASHTGRMNRKLSKMTSIDSKLSRISLTLENLAIIQQERLSLERERFEFERKQAQDRALRIQK